MEERADENLDAAMGRVVPRAPVEADGAPALPLVSFSGAFSELAATGRGRCRAADCIDAEFPPRTPGSGLSVGRIDRACAGAAGRLPFGGRLESLTASYPP
jgi:hypothetical protein